jgi:hypothetical protein
MFLYFTTSKVIINIWKHKEINISFNFYSLNTARAHISSLYQKNIIICLFLLIQLIFSNFAI